jgi:hypothetical protein
MRSLWPGVVLTSYLAACGGGDSKAGERADQEGAAQASAAEVASSGNDPCTLVSRQEMETFMGPLAEPPYRVRRRHADPTGDGCFYRASDGRNVTLTVDWEDGPMVFKMMGAGGGAVEDILGGRDMSADTLEAPWDEVGLAFGQLVALKGNVSVQLDPLGSRLDLGQMARIVDLAMGRLDTPLRYDGAKAARARRPDDAHSGDPCSLLTRAEVEAAMGALRADPHEAEDGSGCVYPLDMEFFGEPVDRSLEVQWTDGFYALGQERQALGSAAKAMAAYVSGDDTPALGEARTGGEPWDEQITLLGGVVTVVKHDVLLKMAGEGMGGFDEDKALGLLRAAVARIE